MDGCGVPGDFCMLAHPHFTDEETETPRGETPAAVTQLLRGGAGIPHTIFLTPESCPFWNRMLLMSARGLILFGVMPAKGAAWGRVLPHPVLLSGKAWGHPTGSSRVKMALEGPREWCTSRLPL